MNGQGCDDLQGVKCMKEHMHVCTFKVLESYLCGFHEATKGLQTAGESQYRRRKKKFKKFGSRFFQTRSVLVVIKKC